MPKADDFTCCSIVVMVPQRDRHSGRVTRSTCVNSFGGKATCGPRKSFDGGHDPPPRSNVLQTTCGKGSHRKVNGLLLLFVFVVFRGLLLQLGESGQHKFLAGPPCPCYHPVANRKGIVPSTFPLVY